MFVMAGNTFDEKITKQHYRLLDKINYILKEMNLKEQINLLFKKAETLEKEGKLEEAISCYQEIKEKCPNWFKIYYHLGLIFLKKDSEEQAIKYLAKSQELNPEFSWTYYYLGEIFEQKKSYFEAIKYYEKALEFQLPEKSFPFHLKLANLLKENEQWETAIKYYEKITKLKPEFPQSYSELGNIYTKKGQVKQAINNYRQALKLKPNDANSYQRLQQLLLETGQIEDKELIKYYQQFQDENNQNNPKILAELGAKFTKKGLIKQSIKCYLKILKIKPDYPIYQALSNVTLHLNKEELEELIIAYQEVIAKNPQLIAAYINLADTLTRQENIKKAIQCYEQATYQKNLKENPQFVTKYGYEQGDRKPNFIIIGAEKCGTSSLYSYITEHPQILEAVEKEIHFFTQHFDKGIDWYKAHFPPIIAGSDYLTGEASTSYINCHNNAPERLFQTFPEVKLIAIIRNPIERTISHYNQLVKLGRENRSLEDLVNLEMDILAPHLDNIWSIKQKYWQVGKGILWHSLYIFFIEKWLTFFPREQLLLLKSEDLFNDSETTMSKIFQYLELPDHKLKNYPNYNQGKKEDFLTDKLTEDLKTFFEQPNQRLSKYFP